MCLWTSSTDKLFYIEQRLDTAKVWHIGQSWVETTEHPKFTQDQMDLQHHLSSPAVLSRQHLETYKDKFTDVVSAITETNFRAEHAEMTA